MGGLTKLPTKGDSFSTHFGAERVAHPRAVLALSFGLGPAHEGLQAGAQADGALGAGVGEQREDNLEGIKLT
jgi:hypothetical protein